MEKRLMEDVKDKKYELRKLIEKKLDTLSREEIQKKLKAIEAQLFEFANFIEAEVSLLYISQQHEVATGHIIRRCMDSAKNIILPVFDNSNGGAKFYKIQDVDADLKKGAGNVLEPNPERCKPVSMENIDIAIIPGVAFDEKGGRLGTGAGRYDRIIPKLPVTARKVAFAFEDQITQMVPMEAHDKFVDIIITEERIIYKI
ncbi:MAG: 5-formyltetrahydrofolate cyclo-ligase [Desulfobacterales bacterium]|nr:5-formyltetrahydrofolate cyclo-ligase [Desulfobacterales bacterium]